MFTSWWKPPTIRSNPCMVSWIGGSREARLGSGWGHSPHMNEPWRECPQAAQKTHWHSGICCHLLILEFVEGDSLLTKKHGFFHQFGWNILWLEDLLDSNLGLPTFFSKKSWPNLRPNLAKRGRKFVNGFTTKVWCIKTHHKGMGLVFLLRNAFPDIFFATNKGKKSCYSKKTWAVFFGAVKSYTTKKGVTINHEIFGILTKNNQDSFLGPRRLAHREPAIAPVDQVLGSVMYR